MPPSVRALLSGIIDYAGMFPPAQLPLEEAIRNYARYRTEPESWMLGRFICPAVRLAELSPFIDELFRDGPPLSLTVLGRSDFGESEFSKAVDDDFTAIASFRGVHKERVTVDTFETHLPDPPPTWSESSRVSECARAVTSLADRHGLLPIRIYYESSLGADRLGAAARVIQGLALTHTLTCPGPQGALAPGFKVRCGGTNAAAVPSSQDLASIIGVSIQFQVPLKFTAGLHHAIRHFSDDMQTHVHGFLNVFTAGVLKQSRFVTSQPILEDERAKNFVFAEGTMRWQDVRPVTEDEIRDARQNVVTSFGSCSFDEPRDDLRAMGLLP